MIKTPTTVRSYLSEEFGKWVRPDRISASYQSSKPGIFFFIGHLSPTDFRPIGCYQVFVRHIKDTDKPIEDRPVMGAERLRYLGVLQDLRKYAEQCNLSIKRISLDNLPSE